MNNTILEIIKNRRSVFPVQYNDQPIAKETIEKLLEAANWAPTHKKTEPWRFKVIQGETLAELGKAMARTYTEHTEKPSSFKEKKLEENPKKAACVIAICMQRDPKESLPEWEEIAATAMAVQNMWLAASDLGIGAYWSSPGIIQYMDDFLQLKTGEKCLGFFYLGNYDEQLPSGIRKPIEEKVTWL